MKIIVFQMFVNYFYLLFSLFMLLCYNFKYHVSWQCLARICNTSNLKLKSWSSNKYVHCLVWFIIWSDFFSFNIFFLIRPVHCEVENIQFIAKCKLFTFNWQWKLLCRCAGAGTTVSKKHMGTMKKDNSKTARIFILLFNKLMYAWLISIE